MVRVDHDSVRAGAERIDTGFEVVEFNIVVRRVASGRLQSHADRKQRVHSHEGQTLEADKRWPLCEFVNSRLVSSENRHPVDPIDGVVASCIRTYDHGLQAAAAHEDVIITERGSGSDVSLLH
jgi:hypothetical protein